MPKRKAALVNQPAGRISRKVFIPGVIGAATTAIFAAEPQILALIPGFGPYLALAKTVAPILLPAIGYQVKEWGKMPVPASIPVFRPR